MCTLNYQHKFLLHKMEKKRNLNLAYTLKLFVSAVGE